MMRWSRALALIAAFAAFQASLAKEPKSANDAKVPVFNAVRLTDDELDQIHAGTLMFLLLNNPGKDGALTFVHHQFRCQNLCGTVPDKGAVGIMFVVTSNHGHVVSHCIGGVC
jgi:hypothetical protein